MFLDRNISIREAFAEKAEQVALEMYDLTLALRSGDPLQLDAEDFLVKLAKNHNVMCELIQATQFLEFFLRTDENGAAIVEIVYDGDDTDMPGM